MRALCLILVLLLTDCGSPGGSCSVSPPPDSELTAYFAPFEAAKYSFERGHNPLPAALLGRSIADREMYTYWEFHPDAGDADIVRGILSLSLITAPSPPHTYDEVAYEVADCIGYEPAWQFYYEPQQVTYYQFGRPHSLDHSTAQINWLTNWALEKYPTVFIAGSRFFFDTQHSQGFGESF
jgi:hypothetical protein